MDKKNLKKGLSGMLELTASTEEQEQNTEKPANKTACYSLPVELLEKLREVAFYDKRKINAVVTIALQRYFDEWDREREKAGK